MVAARVENPSRTAEHLARVVQRRRRLEEDLSRMFPSAMEIIAEIGCGHGHFLSAYAAAHPDRMCVGVDIIRERIERATRKRNRAKLTHLHFILADAYEFLSALPSHVTFSAIFVLFPDPWPKRRHHKNRLIQREFLDALAARAGEGTRIFFRTDHQAYFAEAVSCVGLHPAWQNVVEAWPFEMETVFQARAAGYHSLVAVRTAKS